MYVGVIGCKNTKQLVQELYQSHLDSRADKRLVTSQRLGEANSDLQSKISTTSLIFHFCHIISIDFALQVSFIVANPLCISAMFAKLAITDLLTLPNSQVKIPRLGFGVYLSYNKQCVASCLAALKAGYRYVSLYFRRDLGGINELTYHF
jgi:hypothetical protein